MASRSFAEAVVGEQLPTLTVALTRTLIMAGALVVGIVAALAAKGLITTLA